MWILFSFFLTSSLIGANLVSCSWAFDKGLSNKWMIGTHIFDDGDDMLNKIWLVD